MTTKIPQALSSPASTSRGEFVAKVGTVISAIVASACCWLPLALLAVGVSGAGIASTLDAYRPIFIVVTFGFLAAAFYFTYRPRRSAAGEHACCASEPTQTSEEVCCAPTGKGRFSMMAMNKIMLWVVTALAAAFLFFPNYVGLFLPGDNRMTANMNRAVVKIEGMTCEACSVVVANAIRTAPGVREVAVDYKTGQAVVATEARNPIPKDQILAALKNAGYKGTLVTGCCALPMPTEEGNGSNSAEVSGSHPESPDETTVAEPSDRK